MPAPRHFVHANVIALACAAVVRAFDAIYHVLRARVSLAPDALLHYHWILTWWNHGDSIRGFTLTPSPYLIDIAIQVPIALLAPDFEVFSYVLTLVIALAFFASLFAAVRIATAGDGLAAAGNTAAVAVAGLAVVAFYMKAPFALVVHAFTYNHTSEVYSTLALVALLWGLFRRGAPRRRYAPVVYALAVAACVLSSPFFIATYCIPASFAVAALLGTEQVDRRRLAWFLGLTVAGALAGLIALALMSRYAWPVRGDQYTMTARESWERLLQSIELEPPGLPHATNLWRITLVATIGAAASIALAVLARRARRWGAAFLLAFYPAALVSCVVLPIKRGAYDTGYALRYFQLPWLLAAAFWVAVAVYGIRMIAVRVARTRRLPAAPRYLPWSAGALGAGAIALAATARGPLTMYDAASNTSPSIACFASVERAAGLEDGIAGPWMARFLNAARGSPDWRSPHVVVQILLTDPPLLDSRENNVAWFDGAYRGGRARLNFLATHALSDQALTFWRARLGPPDRTITCPSPVDLRPDGKDTFDLWIWDRQDAQQRLAEFVTRDNMRSPFAPVVGAEAMAIDPTWGMASDPEDSELTGGRRVWRRGVHRGVGANAGIRALPMVVPSGRYRLEIELSAVPRAGGSPDDQAAIVVVNGGTARERRYWIEVGTTRASLELRVKNRGGPTSGDILWITVYPQAAESLELTGMTLTLLEPRGIDPFRIFR